jgi:hypothetical protein
VKLIKIDIAIGMITFDFQTFGLFFESGKRTRMNLTPYKYVALKRTVHICISVNNSCNVVDQQKQGKQAVGEKSTPHSTPDEQRKGTGRIFQNLLESSRIFKNKKKKTRKRTRQGKTWNSSSKKNNFA